MYKKTLLSLAVASSITLTGCIQSGDDEVAVNPDATSATNPAGSVWPIFDPATGALPLPNDLLFSSGPGDGTFGVLDGNGLPDRSSPITAALNDLSGASTVAPAVISFNGQLSELAGEAPAYLQNVFLLELDYASGDPVLGLGLGEAPSGVSLVMDATVQTVQLDGEAAIRILPTAPLNPFKRYIAVVTNEIRDVNGDQVFQSPAYKFLTREKTVTGALGPVQSLINRVWEPVVVGFFNADGSVNAQRASLELPPLDASNIALSYSFTTSNDEKVLSYILDPTAYLVDTIRGQARIAGIRAGGPGSSTAAADAGEAAFIADSPAPSIALAAAGAAAAIDDNLPEGTEFPVPKGRGETATFGDPQDVALLSALAGNFVDYGQVDAYQGTITTPYYLGVPTTRGGSDAEGAIIHDQAWQADATIASVASTVLGLESPLAQADPSVSTVVNYRFALPDLVEELDIPILVLRPEGHTAGDPTIIYQHGITTDRSTAITFGSALANATGAAVVAIDHPVHGVAPFSAEDQQELALTLLAAGGIVAEPALDSNDEPIIPGATQATIDAVVGGTFKVGALLQIQAGLDDADPGGAPNLGITDPTNPTQIQNAINTVLSGALDGSAPTAKPSLVGAIGLENAVANAGSTVPGIAKTTVERHFDYTASAASRPTAMTDTSGASGSLFINLGNFTNTRDKTRQSILDLVNLRMSLGEIDLDDDDTDDLNGSDVYFVGHSLGTIVGLPFVAIVNESETSVDDIVAASMLTPGGGIVRLLENSPSFAPRILGGLSALGLNQGDANLELFLNVNQAAVDSADPVNFADNLVSSSSRISLQQVNGDLVIPNSDDETYAGDNPFVDNAFDAPLAGSEPLATLLGATNVNNANETENFGPFTGVPMNSATVTRYLAGTHGTPVLPARGDLDERVFAEMVGQVTSMITSMGAIVVSDINGDVNPPEQDPDITEVVEQ